MVKHWPLFDPATGVIKAFDDAHCGALVCRKACHIGLGDLRTDNAIIPANKMHLWYVTQCLPCVSWVKRANQRRDMMLFGPGCMIEIAGNCNQTRYIFALPAMLQWHRRRNNRSVRYIGHARVALTDLLPGQLLAPLPLQSVGLSTTSSDNCGSQLPPHIGKVVPDKQQLPMGDAAPAVARQDELAWDFARLEQA